MCSILTDADGTFCISSVGELRKWAYPHKVPMDEGHPPGGEWCLCGVDWDALGKSLGVTVEYDGNMTHWVPTGTCPSRCRRHRKG